MVRTAHDPVTPARHEYIGRCEGYSCKITPITCEEPLVKFNWHDWCREQTELERAQMSEQNGESHITDGAK